jgi:hypothetical protein
LFLKTNTSRYPHTYQTRPTFMGLVKTQVHSNEHTTLLRFSTGTVTMRIIGISTALTLFMLIIETDLLMVRFY